MLGPDQTFLVAATISVVTILLYGSSGIFFPAKAA